MLPYGSLASQGFNILNWCPRQNLLDPKVSSEQSKIPTVTHSSFFGPGSLKVETHRFTVIPISRQRKSSTPKASERPQVRYRDLTSTSTISTYETHVPVGRGKEVLSTLCSPRQLTCIDIRKYHIPSYLSLLLVTSSSLLYITIPTRFCSLLPHTINTA